MLVRHSNFLKKLISMNVIHHYDSLKKCLFLFPVTRPTTMELGRRGEFFLRFFTNHRVATSTDMYWYVLHVLIWEMYCEMYCKNPIFWGCTDKCTDICPTTHKWINSPTMVDWLDCVFSHSKGLISYKFSNHGGLIRLCF